MLDFIQLITDLIESNTGSLNNIHAAILSVHGNMTNLIGYS